MDSPSSPDEPLNLTVKKMPIAIVAPFSRSTEIASNNNNQQQQQQQQQQEIATDLSVKNSPSEQLRNYLDGRNSLDLTAWYVNSLSPGSNRILNNLLEKKPYATYSFPSNFEALIKGDEELLDKGPQDHHKNSADAKTSQDNEKKKPHIKKPLNAFMLYMKEMRAKVVAECTLKESAAINQILGRRWHALGREEQAKYYELARRERQLHMQLYPDWSSRANATRGKKRKRKQDPQDGGNSMKKCRARYGLDQQSQWCKPCSPEGGGGGTSTVQGGLMHLGGGAAAAQSSQEPTYVNL